MANNKTQKAFDSYIDSEITDYIEDIKLIKNKIKRLNLGKNTDEIMLRVFIETTMWIKIAYLVEARKIAREIFGKKIDIPEEIEKDIEQTKSQQVVLKDGDIEMPNGVPVDVIVDHIRQTVD